MFLKGLLMFFMKIIENIIIIPKSGKLENEVTSSDISISKVLENYY